MRNFSHTLTAKLVRKIGVSFLLLIILMGASYVVTTLFFAQKYRQEATQQLNVHLAQHLIEEKFQNEAPFLADGQVNKALFGDLMHDMMAVNRAIEVYLLNDEGDILYSVVLDHSNPAEPLKRVRLAPIQEFISTEGSSFVLGDDPRNPGEEKVFSAAAYNVEGHQGYIYIILESQVEAAVAAPLATSNFLKLGVGASLLTMLFVLGLGWAALWFLTKNLREIIYAVNRFREGDHDIRISEPEKSDIAILATHFNDMADTVVENMDALKSVDTLRRELIANVSHDLRTPLAIINGYIETLQMKVDDLSPQTRDQYLHIIQESSTKLNTLIGQLFEYSKLEANQVVPQKEPFSIAELAYDMRAKYQLLAKQQGIQLEVKGALNLPLVFADISLVERALQNLLDNALKFTPEKGTVSLHLSATDTDVTVRIKDTGPGIPKEQQAFIFDRHRQAESPQASQGAGLGLAIVKKIMELHNTHIQVISTPPAGSAFQFSLPLAG